MADIQKINAVKEQYFRAKARIQELDRQSAKLEQIYIIEHGIRNPDGSTPQRIEDIEDDDTFQTVNDSFRKEMEKYDGEYRIARESLRSAGDILVKCSINLAPKWMHGMLLAEVEWNAELRQKLIDIFLHLNLSIFR